MICILTDDSVEAAASMTKGAAGCDLPSVSSSHRSDTIVGRPLSIAPNTKVVCSVATLAKVTEDVSVPVEGDLEAT